MIGVLCNQKNEQLFSRRIHTIFQSFTKERNIPVIVFSIENINLEENTVVGSLVSEKTVSVVKAELPSLIFNLAVHYTRTDIKKIRNLMELDLVSIINITNRYNQRTIIEMLTSSAVTGRYVLPFRNSDNENKEQSYIMKPLRGANLKKLVYVNRMQATSGYPSFDPTKKSELLFLKAPELITCSNKLCTARVYLQRNYNGDWKILSRTLPDDGSLFSKLKTEIDTVSIEITGCINKFIVDIFICLIDFVADMDGNLYLLSFGGWDNKILFKKENREVQVQLGKNLLEYAEAFIERQRSGDDNVD